MSQDLSRFHAAATADPAAAGQMDKDCWRETGASRREVKQTFWFARSSLARVGFIRVNPC